MKTLLILLIFLCRIAFGLDSHSIEGRWKTIDDKTGRAKSVIRIEKADGHFTGRIEKLFRDPDKDQNPLCVKCPGSRKDQPMIGMTILWDLAKTADGWGHGSILDPANGKIYSCQAELIGAGDRLKVRGYLGVPLIGRTQVWERLPTAQP